MDGTYSPGAIKMGRSLCGTYERLRKGRFLSSDGFGVVWVVWFGFVFFFKLEAGAVKLSTQNIDKVHVASAPGWAAGEHASEELQVTFPHQVQF